MEAVKKYLFWGIFISILSIFAMSHNASAFELTINLDDYSLARDDNRNGIDVFYDNDQTTCSGTFQCSVYNTNSYSSVKRLRTHGTFNLRANDIVVFRLFIGSQSSTGDYTNIVPFQQKNFSTNQDNFVYIGHKQYLVNNENILSQLGYGPNANEFYTQISTVYQDLRIYEYYFRVQANGLYYVGFDSNNYNSKSADIFTLAAYSSMSSVYFRSINTQVYHYNGSKENQEVEQKTQEAVDESEAAGGDSSTSAQTGTTGLLNAITGAVSVISSAQPTNCKINGNMGNLDIGQLDLCANPAPTFVQTIGSLILILMCVPLAISLFNRFIAIFRSFQS